MTNHPRRLGRRKLQRQDARRWVDLTPYVTGVKFGPRVPVSVDWQQAYESVQQAMTATPDEVAALQRSAVQVWANGRIDVVEGRIDVGTRPVRRRLDIDLREPA